MTLYYLTCALFIIMLIFSVFCTIVFIIEENGVDASVTVSFVCVVLFSILCYNYISNYAEKVAIKADQFFSTRNEVYECEPIDSYACTLKIKEWKEDSVYWQNMVDEIFKE